MFTAVPFKPRAQESFPTLAVKSSPKSAILSPVPITSHKHEMFSRFGLSRSASKQKDKMNQTSGTVARHGVNTRQEIRQPKLETRCPVEGWTYTYTRTGNTALLPERMIVYSNRSGCDLLREVRRPLNYIDHVTQQRTIPKKSARFTQRHDSGAQGLVMPTPMLQKSSSAACESA